MPCGQAKIKYSLTLWRQVGDFSDASVMLRDAGDAEAKQQELLFSSLAQEADFDLPGLPPCIQSPSAPVPTSPRQNQQQRGATRVAGHQHGGQSLSCCHGGLAQTQNSNTKNK